MSFFAARMAAREWRSALRRLGVYMSAITFGVAALVALHAFRADVVRSIESENQSLLGADIRISSSRALPDSITRIVDSLTTLGARAARATSLTTMALSERTGLTRIVQLRAVEEGFPFYGEVRTDPPGEWERLAMSRSALVDDAVLAQLDAAPGDTLLIGEAHFEIAGVVSGLPMDVGLQSAIGPRVFIHHGRLEDTGLLVAGSLARRYRYLRLPEGIDPDEVEESWEETLRKTQVSFRTPAEQAQSLTESAELMSEFLGLVALAALLLGGVGVGSAVHVYVKGKRAALATLRCVGATRAQVFGVYAAQATLLGLAGAIVGAALGTLLQRLLPLATKGIFPVDVTSGMAWDAILPGIFLGGWVAFVFALPPLLETRRVSPMGAFRQSVSVKRGSRAAKGVVLAAIIATLALATVREAPTPEFGVFFAAALVVTGGVLVAAAAALMWATRRFFPRWAPYVARQGVANLFRPGNQTTSVTLALGFGVFVAGTILQAQRTVMDEIEIEEASSGYNLLLFDIQPDQEEAILETASKYAEGPVALTPVVTSRIAAINGRNARDILADTLGDPPERWTLRREYRNSFRSEMLPSEALVEGEWWSESAPAPTDERAAGISIDQNLADDMRVGVGDTIVWSIQGREVVSTVANVRRVDWSSFDANFLVIFEPWALAEAPRTGIAFLRVPEEEGRIRFQQEIVRAHPNVSILDMSTVRATVEEILSRVGGVVSLLALLCAVTGLVVIAGAVSSSRTERKREVALLHTLGARSGQLRWILFAEYAALGSLAAAVGGGLAVGSGWLLAGGVFQTGFAPALWGLAQLWAATVAIALIVGVTGGGGLRRRLPLAALRRADP